MPLTSASCAHFRRRLYAISWIGDLNRRKTNVQVRGGATVDSPLESRTQARLPCNELVRLPGIVQSSPACFGTSQSSTSAILQQQENTTKNTKSTKGSDDVLLEKYLEGVEITGAVLGNLSPEALPLVEIIPGDQYEFFDYEAKYKPGATEEICPARLSEEITKKAQDYAVRAHQALKCRGYSRTDMIVSNEEVYILETNTIPGMTATSLYPQAAAAAGISFSELLDRLIELALEKD